MGHQKSLKIGSEEISLPADSSIAEKLQYLMDSDLDFHKKKSSFGTHKIHSFPAKFPPQLPVRFIKHLTKKDQVVLDPMMGSGTTILEAAKRNRTAIGIDLDPLSVLMVKVKTRDYNKKELKRIGLYVLEKSQNIFNNNQDKIKEIFENKFDSKTKKFIRYWFAETTILELTALISEIERDIPTKYKDFLKVVFSSTIITKTGGVSLAIDLAHTRPHKAKKVFDLDNNVLYENNLSKYSERRQEILTKNLRSAFDLFNSKLFENIEAVFNSLGNNVSVKRSDAQNLPIDDDSIDLIVTSPPYAANAIDYMRAHKFSLVWFGKRIDELSDIRSEYIGGESTSRFNFKDMPDIVNKKISELQNVDRKRSKVLHRYFTEISNILSEMYRVLKPNSCAILVVGNSNLKGVNTELQKCLPEIGKAIGFKIPAIGVRNLDRNKRMLPAGFDIDNSSQIEKRMHLEYVISFLK